MVSETDEDGWNLGQELDPLIDLVEEIAGNVSHARKAFGPDPRSAGRPRRPRPREENQGRTRFRLLSPGGLLHVMQRHGGHTSEYGSGRLRPSGLRGPGFRLPVVLLRALLFGSGAVTAITLTCDMCGGSKAFDQPEVETLVAAFKQGDGEALRCPACGTSLARPLQRALNLSPTNHLPPTEGQTRRQHLRLSFDLPASFSTPEGKAGRGQVKNLSDGGLLLVTQEILPPATHLQLDLQTRQGRRAFEGDVMWNDAERRSNAPPIAHGIRFAGPVVPGLAVDLFMLEATPRTSV
jgi:hypothetical protein